MLILLTEDDADYAEIIAEILRRDGHEVVVAGSANGAERFARQGEPDLAVIDVILPDGSGLDVARHLRDERPEMPILFLSSLDRTSDVVAGFDAGGDDYLAKPFHPRELVARVRALARRSSPNGSAAHASASGGVNVSREGLVIDEANRAVYFDGADLNCTQLELEILRELTATPGEVLTYAFLNDRVWGYRNMSDGALLKGHVSSIRRKLRRAGGDPESIRTVHGVGYAFNP